MNWEQKMQACQSIGEVSLHMRKPGDWYINHFGVCRREGHFLSGGCVIEAKTPEEAVNQHWDWLTDKKFHLDIDGAKGKKIVRWNGFMWEDVHENIS